MYFSSTKTYSVFLKRKTKWERVWESEKEINKMIKVEI